MQGAWTLARSAWLTIQPGPPTSHEVHDLWREATALKEVVADLTLENRVLKKKRDGGRGGRRIRMSGLRKLEIIRLVEQSHLPVRRVLEQFGIPGPST